MASGKQPTDNARFFDDADERVSFNRVWFNLMRAHRKFHPRIAKALKPHGIKDPIWYEILLEIDRAGPGGRLMSAIEETLFGPSIRYPGTLRGWRGTGFCAARLLPTDGASSSFS